MKTTILIIMATTGLFCCGQAGKSTTDPVDVEGINSVRNYEYADSKGNRLIIHNSVPNSKVNYTDLSGKKYNYAVFWTQITNETINPVELKINFPLDSFEFPRSSGNYMKLLIPSDTMTPDKASLSEYGLAVKSFLDTGINKSYSLTKTIHPKESIAFYVVTLSNHGSGGALRTGLRLKGQSLFYNISAYKMAPELPLIDEKEINCGSINLKGLVFRK